MAMTGRPGKLTDTLSRAWRRLRRRFGGNGNAHLRVGGPSPERLLLAPPDLFTPDPTVAQEIYAGIFHFAGKSVDCAGISPFLVDPPSAQWAGELHSFTWLHHLAASGGPLSATNAQAFVKDWVKSNPRPDNSPAWQPQATSMRLISWICHSPLIVEKIDPDTYRALLKSIGYQIRYLRAIFSSLPDGLPRLLCLTALAYAEICVSWQKKQPRTAQRALDTEIVRQILADGSHVSRNPAINCDLLALFLPLRQTLVRVGVSPSPEMLSAIDRMMPTLRFFRLGDGTICRFNGAGATPHDLIATLLRYDDVLGATPQTLPYGGYCRLEASGTILLADIGKAPAGDYSVMAHAGTLAFEMTSGDAPLIVNCGQPLAANRQQALASRSTAAHSTAVLNDMSSSRFEQTGIGGDSRLLPGPTHVSVNLLDGDAGRKLIASHDGYGKIFGLVHERQLELPPDGRSLSGRDSFTHLRNNSLPGNIALALRFHLHPSVRILESEHVNTLRLRLRNGDEWLFGCEEVTPLLEESVFFAGPEGPRRTAQIVLRGKVAELNNVSWSMHRV